MVSNKDGWREPCGKNEGDIVCTIWGILREDWDLLEKIGAQSIEESPWKRKTNRRTCDERETLKTIS